MSVCTYFCVKVSADCCRGDLYAYICVYYCTGEKTIVPSLASMENRALTKV